MKRVALVAPPFSGHLHPLLGIGRALADVAEVRVFSSAAAQGAIAGAGLDGATLLAGEDAAIAAIANPPRRAGSHPLRLHAQLRANLALMQRFRSELAAALEDWKPQLLIADFTLPVAGSVARALQIPWWTSLPSPCVLEAPGGPPAYLGGWQPRDDRFGQIRDALGRLAIRLFKRGVGRLYRRELAALGIASLYRADGSEAAYSDERILALGLREFEYARAWPAAVEFTGPVLYTPPYAGPPPDFAAGRAQVLVTLGTHLHWHKPAALAAVHAAARTLPGVDFHFSRGDAEAALQRRDGNVEELAYVSYARDLPRYDLVVHHGGAGILYRCLQLGIPSLVLPLDYDQFDHAARLHSAGIARRLRSLDALAPAVAAALNDTALRERCLAWRDRFAGPPAEIRIAAAVAERLQSS
ncbi:MAG TPA: nucleotide disphospho-sugar-binding domain-containing protein [Tahibacter sp.]|nr:nucleotide disphospho-sugar-binding domain-containing protein [Tahibacter sp.]